jgi:phosphate/sulfate permease
VVVIVASWFISPLMAGIMSFILYTILRLAVLRGGNSTTKAIWCLPILLFVTLFVNMLFVLYKVCWRGVLGRGAGQCMCVCVGGGGAMAAHCRVPQHTSQPRDAGRCLHLAGTAAGTRACAVA